MFRSMADRVGGRPASPTTSTVQAADWPDVERTARRHDAVRFLEIDISERTMSGVGFFDCTFRGARFNGSTFRDVAFANCTFIDCGFFDVRFSSCKLVGAMYFGFALFLLVVAGSALLIARIPIAAFIRAVREPALIAFTTASSEAALPKALEAMERFGVPRSIVGFVLPTGYSFNLDGSTFYLSMASVFVAQMAGVELTWGQQLTMLLTLMLTSKGVAGVPRASLVVLMATLTTFGPAYGIPLEGAAILLGIDQILDMGRTAVNVIGNCVASVVVARWEGVFDDARMKEAA